MYYVSEQTCRDLVSQEAIHEVIARTYVAMATGRAVNFPVVRETLGYENAIFGFKSGNDRGDDSAPQALGVKAGGLWPGNRAKGLPNHQSTVVLFDTATGGPKALVRGTYLTALRTAAASALSIEHLARQDARTLGILGAGGQAEFQVAAALRQRAFERVLISDRSSENAEALQKTVSDSGVESETVPPEEMARASEVIITIVPTFEPVLRSEWVRPGTHLACMGTDTLGKQEVDADLLPRCRLYGDEIAQNVSIGECQHAAREGLIRAEDITLIGDVLRDASRGRRSDEEITLFDSTGVGLQDIAAGEFALTLAQREGRAIELE
ncbi:MAG: ornithine cyclodeaminase family protein [Acidobacteriota bacterium]